MPAYAEFNTPIREQYRCWNDGHFRFVGLAPNGFGQRGSSTNLCFNHLVTRGVFLDYRESRRARLWFSRNVAQVNAVRARYEFGPLESATVDELRDPSWYEIHDLGELGLLEPTSLDPILHVDTVAAALGKLDVRRR